MAKLKHFRILNIQHFVIFITIINFTSCQQRPTSLKNIEAKELAIDSTATSEAHIATFVRPYRERINLILDSALAYAPYTISKSDGTYNTTEGNLMADLMLSETNPIYKIRTGKDIDFVLMNHGGIRASISKGNVSARTAYEVMPFENNIAVVALKGTSVLELVDYLVKSNRAHPVAGIQIILNTNDTVHSISIQGKPLDENTIYHVATSDYLVDGGDDMVFFKNGVSFTTLDYKIRNAIIDYFTKVDTLSPKIDDRYYKMD
ncbi:5'-nucleotidase C-terminal domain-containing protein [Maribacter antarcticus]|uniref:5'-nucleotidase C-terminal domain-containing protein n=1 Tax=Maribacter antarcticus TaxID=505250 RepID=UPI000565431F|nr:5'-nucleotidase [Maribacter antarcticus]